MKMRKIFYNWRVDLYLNSDQQFRDFLINISKDNDSTMKLIREFDRGEKNLFIPIEFH